MRACKKASLFATLLTLLLACCTTPTQPAATAPAITLRALPPPRPDFDRDIQPLLTQYCITCHSNPFGSGGMLLFKNEQEVRDRVRDNDQFLPHMTQLLTTRKMPPPDAPKKLPDQDRQLLLNWVAALRAEPPHS